MDNMTALKILSEKLSDMGIDPSEIQINIKDDVAFLSGHIDKWKHAVDAGHIVAKLDDVKNVVCDILADDKEEKEKIDLHPYYNMDVVDRCDVAIIGGGITGTAIMRQLSKYDLDILVIEKEDDISCGTTKANNGMIHSGYDPKAGTLKAKLNVKGNAMYDKWAKELGFSMEHTGSFVCGFDEDDRKSIQLCYENGVKNKVPGIEILSGDDARKLEPALSSDITSVLYTPTSAYVEPYEVALALTENAIDNGARIRLGLKVLDIVVENGKAVQLVTDKGKIDVKFVVNAAGLYADEVAEMADDRFYSIHPRRGALAIFDKENAEKIRMFSGTAPGPYSKGGGPMMTPDGTSLWGPSAKEVTDKEDLGVDKDDLDFIIDKGLELVKGIDPSSLITYFGGNRAATYSEDFIIENSKVLRNFTHVSGIQSPGLASAPAIAEMVDELFVERFGLPKENPLYNPLRKPIKPFRDCNMEERKELIEKDSRYGRIICRCETVTEAEIVNAIHGKVPATNIDAIKRRTRAGMGRCQSGFCGSKVLDILANELHKDKLDITLRGNGTNILLRTSRKTDLSSAVDENGVSDTKSTVNENADVVIIGGGPAGLAAAVKARKLGIRKVVVLERDSHLGGILNQCIHDGFGLLRFKKQLSGCEYAGEYIDMLNKYGADIYTDTMVLEITKDKKVYASNPNGLICFKAKSIILAMGCRERTRPQVRIYGDRPAGVLTAGAVQKYINMEGYIPGKKAVILGSGDIGLIMARRMTLEGIEVEGVYEIMQSPGGLRRNIVQCLDDYSIPLHLSTTITAIHGKNRVEGVTVAKVDQHREIIPFSEKFIPCDLVVLSVGLLPENELSRKIGIQMDPSTKAPIVNSSMMTSIPGIFAAGNVSAVFDLVDYVSKTGENAALGAFEYMTSQSSDEKIYSTIPGENVQFILPQKVNAANKSGLDLYLRVKKSMGGTKIDVSCDGIILKSVKKIAAHPPEMIHLHLDPSDKICGNLKIDVKEV